MVGNGPTSVETLGLIFLLKEIKEILNQEVVLYLANVVNSKINHPPVITFFAGGMVTIPKWVVFGIVLGRGVLPGKVEIYCVLASFGKWS